MRTLLTQHSGIVQDRQCVLGELLGTHTWGVDLETGIFRFGGPDITTPFEVLGTYSWETHSWLWSWANESIPESLTAIARMLRERGQADGIEMLYDPSPDIHDSDLHAFGVLACGLGGADSYYPADFGDGLLLIALTGDVVSKNWKPEYERILFVVPQLLQTFELDHKEALRCYLAALGCRIREEENSIATDVNDALIVAQFDDVNRLIALRGILED